MKINNFWGDLSSISAKKEALVRCHSLHRSRIRTSTKVDTLMAEYTLSHQLVCHSRIVYAPNVDRISDFVFTMKYTRFWML